MKTPVALIIFKRPDTTEKVFEAIRQAKPPKLLVIADGPRADRPGEAENCAATRAIIDRVDWDCEVLKNYSDVNLGCGRRPATGISWVFEQVEEAIILEDDCLPSPTFFRFCEELLEYYRDEPRVMHISGSNFLCARQELKYSYYFSTYTFCWGWASWRRAWKYFDYKISLWPVVREQQLLSGIFDSKAEELRREKIWDSLYQGKIIDVWDYQWLFSVLSQGGFSVVPAQNLVSNVGYRPDATHTKKVSKFRSNLSTSDMEFPLVHPPVMMRDFQADRNYERISQHGKLRSLITRLSRVVGKNK